MTFKEKCPVCKQTSYGWGSICICGLPLHFDMSSPVIKLKYYGNVHTGRTVWENIPKIEVYMKGRDYDNSVKDANRYEGDDEDEPDHDLEYHDKKCEGR